MLRSCAVLRDGSGEPSYGPVLSCATARESRPTVLCCLARRLGRAVLRSCAVLPDGSGEPRYGRASAAMPAPATRVRLLTIIDSRGDLARRSKLGNPLSRQSPLGLSLARLHDHAPGCSEPPCPAFRAVLQYRLSGLACGQSLVHDMRESAAIMRWRMAGVLSVEALGLFECASRDQYLLAAAIALFALRPSARCLHLPQVRYC